MTPDEQTQGDSHVPATFEQRRRRMIYEDIYRRGVTDPRVLKAMDEVPRERFLPMDLSEAAYEDRALPIAGGQTISQPYIVAYMTERLELTPQSRVLEIGTGTGYQTAVLARLAGHVCTIERLDTLHRQAAGTLGALGVVNVQFVCGDGTLGLPSEAPFDRILVTAGAPEIPRALLQQLADGGVLVAPIGGEVEQRIVHVRRLGGRTHETTLIPVRFVRLIGSEGWPAD
ncbi:MAG: protein-L-isoaspartate(D-aspartate) O-methyltransferase [Phycisphaerales bacterium]|nr:protein-L-isoaspartate(D-aspartate) O-methyltransferase [Phycisphaerales bacterium]